MALNPSGIMSIGGPSVGSSINLELGLSATANSSLNQASFRALAGIPSGTIALSNFYGKASTAQRGIFTFSFQAPTVPTGSNNSINYVSDVGILAANVTGAGTARNNAAATGYGGDKAIFAYGIIPTLAPASRVQNMSNLVSNTGVVAADTPGVGSARQYLAAAGYGGDKGVFAYGVNPGPNTLFRVSNLVSNTGVIAADTPISPVPNSARIGGAAASYGNDKAIFGFGTASPTATSAVGSTVLVTNTGVFGTDVPAVATGRWQLAAAGYGNDKAIFGYGFIPNITPGTRAQNITNLVSNTGVVAANTPGVGTVRTNIGASSYGGDKAIFAYGQNPDTPGNPIYSMSNLVSNTGVVSTDTPGLGTPKYGVSAAKYSFT
jgi:hypothetical protein